MRMILTHLGTLFFTSTNTRIMSSSEYGAYLPCAYSSYSGVPRITSAGYIFSMSGRRQGSENSL